MMCHVCEGPGCQSLLDLAEYASRVSTSRAEVGVCPNAYWKNVAGAPGFILAETAISTGGSIFMLEMNVHVQLLVLIEQQL